MTSLGVGDPFSVLHASSLADLLDLLPQPDGRLDVGHTRSIVSSVHGASRTRREASGRSSLPSFSFRVQDFDCGETRISSSERDFTVLVYCGLSPGLHMTPKKTADVAVFFVQLDPGEHLGNVSCQSNWFFPKSQQKLDQVGISVPTFEQKVVQAWQPLAVAAAGSSRGVEHNSAA